MVRALSLGFIALVACNDVPPSDVVDPAVVDNAVAEPAVNRPPDVPALHTGVVLETMDAANYTYVRLQTANETIWFAGPTAKIAVGETLTVPDGALMANFTSPTLGRTFDSIVFVAGYHAGEISSDAKACHDPGVLTEVAAFSTPNDGLAIEEVHARAAELVGKTVVVRGQVTKSSRGILGTNWVHVQDGTGVVAGRTFDLTATTANAEVEVGDVVRIEGPLSTNVDFGAGYKYDVIVQGAAVTVETTRN